ncbi:MAG: DUF4231 domain-containing protein [Synechococcus sp.]
MNSNNEKDLRPQEFPKDLNWSPAEISKSLECLYDFVNQECTRAIKWYYKSKKSKSMLGYFLRVGAIVAVTIAGIIPIIGEIYKEDGVPLISPAWATVSLAIAALLIALDQFGGYTSGWVRYVRTAQKLTILQGDFRLNWAAHRLARVEDNVDAQIAKEGILLCKEFLQSVNLVVQAETNAWAQEFQQALIDIENASKPRHVKPDDGQG